LSDFRNIKIGIFFSLVSVFILLFSNKGLYGQVGLKIPVKYNPIVPYNRYDQNQGLYLGTKTLPLSPDNEIFERKVTIDSVTGYIKISEKIAGIENPYPYLIKKDEYYIKEREKTLRNLFKFHFSSNISPIEKKEEKSKGLGFRIPVPLGSKDFSVDIRVNGSINMTAKVGHQQQSAVRSVHQGSDLNVKLEQTQQFNIVGKVGEKIKVLVDQNSERSFEFENNLRLTYNGEEDEIFQNIQAGNIGLSLKGTQFVSFSGANKGLFGLKADMQIAGLDVTTIASLEKGQKKKLSIKGGAESDEKEIKDYQYLDGKFFFVDKYYRENYKFNRKGQLLALPDDRVIVEIEIWKSDRNYNRERDSKYGWAVADPSNPDTAEGRNQNNLNGYFLRLEKNKDYTLNAEFGYIEFHQPLMNEVIGIAFKDKAGRKAGQLIPEPNKPLVLKLLRTDYPKPTDSCWELEWRNVYQISSTPIPPEGLEISIIDNRSNNQSKIQKDGKNYLEVFALDRINEGGDLKPDGKIDITNGNIFKLNKGLLFLPGHRPFDPPYDPFDPENPSPLDSEETVPTIYDTVFANYNDNAKYSHYSIMVKTSSMSATYNLGMNVLENSEEVKLDGVALQKGIDYTIDYSFGELTILNEKALQPGANLEIDYESAEVFQIEKKTILGARGEYHFNPESFIGATVLFRSEKTIQQQVKVGKEPSQNFIWDINANFQFEPKFLTNFLDKLLLITTDAPSSFKFQGEIAQIVPNPNTMNNPNTNDNHGVAYIDNFEGSKRVSTIMVRRRSWTRSSVPVDKSESDRAKTIWFNPYYQVKIKEILPNKNVNTNTTQTVNVLNIKHMRKEDNDPEESWSGIMTALHTSYFNQTEAKFLEFWVKGDTGKVHIDLGLISEDAITNGYLDTEDKNFNGILDEGEDTGLDGIAAKDGPNSGEPFDDDWFYQEQSGDYSRVNGTENNENDGIREPDTEDINKNGSLDTRNDYYEYVISLHEFTGYEVETYENISGWKYYRIPLSEFARKVGEPDFARVEYARVWVDHMPEKSQISIYKIDLVGNDWKELGIAKNDSASLSFKVEKDEDLMAVGVVNTEDDYPEYKSPPGVEGLQDIVTKVIAKEQSLFLKVTDLPSGQTALCQKSFYDKFDLIHYKYLKLFIHGDENLFGDTTNVEFIMRLGRDDRNYYEIRKPVYTGWDKRNEVILDLAELSKTKLSGKLDEYGNSIREFEDGSMFRVVGNPTLRQINLITFGVKNKSTYNPLSTTLWMDELRVSEVEQIKGIAFRASADLQLADLASFHASLQRNDADFHTVNERFGSGKNTTSGSISGNISLHRLYSAKNIFNIPLSFAYNKSTSIPKYMTGSDILLSKNVPDSVYNLELSERVDKRMSISFSKSTESDNWLLKYTLDKISVGYNFTKSEMHDYNTEYQDQSSTNMSFSYGLSLPDKSISPFFFVKGIPLIGNKIGNIKFHYLPKNFNFSVGAKESESFSKLRGGIPKESRTFNVNRSVSTSFNPFQDLSVSFSRSYNNDLRNFEKTEIIQGILNSDSTETQMSQNFNTSFKPKIFDWLQNTFSYDAKYQLNNNIQYKSSGKNTSISRNMTGDFSINMQDLFSSLGLDLSSTPQPGRTPSQAKEKDEEKKEGGFKISLGSIKSFINSIRDIKINIGKTLTSNEVGLEDKPGFSYQFGFKKETGIDKLETAGNQQARLQATDKISFSTGFNLSRYISVSLNYSKNSTENMSGTTRNGSTNKTVVAISDKDMAFPNWNINWRNMEDFPLFSLLFKSMTLTHGYKGQKTISLEGEGLEPRSEQIQSNFSPLAQINCTLFFGMKLNISYSLSEKINKNLIIDTESKDKTSNIKISTGFQKSGGFSIPLPFLKNKKLKNTINGSITFTQTSSTGYKTNPNTGELTKDVEQSNWNFTPSISYSFTNKINGGIQFKIGKQHNNRVGDRKLVEGSITLNIVISG